MSDFDSSFWEFYIGAITLVSIFACLALLLLMSSRRVSGGSAETTGHTWDEDLGEYNNPLPRWWMWLFILTIVFSLVYLALYPGLAFYKGSYNWTSTGQLEQENKEADAQFGPLYQKFASREIKDIAYDPEARAMGQKLFLNHCAQCHASDGGGSRGFPNLTDRDWLYGADPQTIKTTIANGRNGVMPAFGAALGTDGPRDVAHYLFSLSGRTHDSIRASRGKEKFNTVCVVCHGADAKGNPQLGAPNLTDKIWLHGSSEEAVIESISKGRNNMMPAHQEFLGEAKVHILAAYVFGLSNPASAGK
jgi:cytochrome c oxidase cbb3-type subunit III